MIIRKLLIRRNMRAYAPHNISGRFFMIVVNWIIDTHELYEFYDFYNLLMSIMFKVRLVFDSN